MVERLHRGQGRASAPPIVTIAHSTRGDPPTRQTSDRAGVGATGITHRTRRHRRCGAIESGPQNVHYLLSQLAACGCVAHDATAPVERILGGYQQAVSGLPAPLVVRERSHVARYRAAADRQRIADLGHRHLNPLLNSPLMRRALAIYLPGSQFTGGSFAVSGQRSPLPAQVTRFTRAKLQHACRSDDYALGRVVVSVVDSPAVGAGPAAHGQRKPFQLVAARRAGLGAGEPAVHLHERAAVPRALVFELARDLSPASVRNGAGQPGVAGAASFWAMAAPQAEARASASRPRRARGWGNMGGDLQSGPGSQVQPRRQRKRRPGAPFSFHGRHRTVSSAGSSPSSDRPACGCGCSCC